MSVFDVIERDPNNGSDDVFPGNGRPGMPPT